MDYTARAENLVTKLQNNQIAQMSSLMYILFKVHRRVLLWQWILTIVQSLAAYGPQFCMYKMLEVLESEPMLDTQRNDLWAWAILLGLFRLLQTLLEARYVFPLPFKLTMLRIQSYLVVFRHVGHFCTGSTSRCNLREVHTRRQSQGFRE